MNFDGTEGEFITLAEAAALTQQYRAHFLKGNVKRKGLFFGKEKLQALLAQDNCEGLRIYFGAVEEAYPVNSWQELELVIVGTDDKGNDQLGTHHKILDMGTPCPTRCSTTNSLNS